MHTTSRVHMLGLHAARQLTSRFHVGAYMQATGPAPNTALPLLPHMVAPANPRLVANPRTGPSMAPGPAFAPLPASSAPGQGASPTATLSAFAPHPAGCAPGHGPSTAAALAFAPLTASCAPGQGPSLAPALAFAPHPATYAPGPGQVSCQPRTKAWCMFAVPLPQPCISYAPAVYAPAMHQGNEAVNLTDTGHYMTPLCYMACCCVRLHVVLKLPVLTPVCSFGLQVARHANILLPPLTNSDTNYRQLNTYERLADVYADAILYQAKERRLTGSLRSRASLLKRFAEHVQAAAKAGEEGTTVDCVLQELEQERSGMKENGQLGWKVASFVKAYTFPRRQAPTLNT